MFSDLALAPGPFHLSDLPGQPAGLSPHHPDQRVAPGDPVPGPGPRPHHPADQPAPPPQLFHYHPAGGQGEVPGWPGPAQCSHPADDSLRPGAPSLEVSEGEVGVRLSLGEVC